VETIIGNISKTCGILNKLKYRIPQSILLNIYNILILTYLQYCTIVCANCNHSKLNSLFIIQKRAVGNICKLKYLTHTAPYFKNLHVLTIFDIYTLQVCQFMFKVTFNLLPSSLVTYFQINSAVHSYNTRHLQDYHISSIRTAKHLKTLRLSGPRIWNSLPSEIKAINNFHSFTRSVKSSLLDVYV